MKFRKDLFISSRQYEEDETSERHASWTELLFDLIFVAAISQLALNLSNNYTFTSFIGLIPLFFIIWWGWMGHTFYLSRFGTDDLFNRFFTMAQIIAVAFMTINVKNALGATGSGFAISYAALRLMLVAEYIIVGRKIPETRALTNHYSIGFGIAAIIWLISAFIPAPWRFILWGVAIIIDIFTPLTAGKLHINFPPHPTHLPERFGLLTIILIGEAIVGIVFSVSSAGINIYTEIMALMGLIIAFSIWWGYFEESKGAETRVQESADDIGKYQLWLYSHFPLLLGIVGVAAGIKHVIYLNFMIQLPSVEAWLLCISLGISFLSLNAIFLSSFHWKTCFSRVLLKFRAPYYIIIALVICTGFFGNIVPGSVILAIITILSTIKIILSLRETPAEVCEF